MTCRIMIQLYPLLSRSFRSRTLQIVLFSCDSGGRGGIGRWIAKGDFLEYKFKYSLHLIPSEISRVAQVIACRPTSIKTRKSHKALHIWAGGMGAFPDSQKTSSLDYRLEGSPKTAEQMKELLDESRNTLHNITQPHIV
jgi:hypothetical protein